MSWSQSQLQMLHAMGHQPMVLASSVAEAGSGKRAPAIAQAPAIAPDEGAPATAGGEFSNLLGAIRRASGGRDVSALVTDLARLRRDPAMKRALWPALRTLRRNH